MGKVTAKKRVSRQTAKWPARRIVRIALWSVLILAILTGIGFYAKHKYDVRQDHERFKQAEAHVAHITSEVIAIAGKPLTKQVDNYCTRPSLKYQMGALSCFVQTNLIYEVSGPEEANAFVDKIRPVGQGQSSPWKFTGTSDRPYEMTSDSTNQSKRFGPLPHSFDDESRTDYFTGKLTRMSCHKDYVYYASTSDMNPYQASVLIKNQAIMISLNCYDAAKAQYYPTSHE